MVHLHSRIVFIGWIQGEGSVCVCIVGGAVCMSVLSPVSRITKKK